MMMLDSLSHIGWFYSLWEGMFEGSVCSLWFKDVVLGPCYHGICMIWNNGCIDRVSGNMIFLNK